MSLRKPPALANWLLDRLGYTRQNAALAGDLLEEFRSGRSRAWYWRQTFMVIANGIGRNAVVLWPYLRAVLGGYAAQVVVSFTLWRFGLPRELHAGNGAKVGLWLLIQFGYCFFMCLVNRIMVGQFTSDLKPLYCAGEGDARRQSTILATAAFQTFAGWLAGYSMCELIMIRFSAASLIWYEMVWLVLWELWPVLLPATATGPLPAEMPEMPEVAAEPAEPRVYRPHELALDVTLPDGRTILLPAETIAEAAFTAADEKLIGVLFGRSASLELLRRAIWLGSFRHFGEPRDPVSLLELAQLVNQAARTERVEQAFFDKPRESRWQRLRRRFRQHAD
jgi:hypothetical protein